MAWYDIGTVSVTNGSTTVTGSGTNFIAGAQIGEAFYGPDNRLYEIQAIVSATVLTLGSPYLGATQTGQSYYIIPTQSLVATLANEVSSLITDFQSVADLAGAGKFADGTAALPGITFNLDQDTGFSRPAANQIGFSTAGVQRALLSSTALTLNVPVSGTVGTFSGDATIHGATVGRGGGAVDTNTANGFQALFSNTTGTQNTANGRQALLFNTTGINNTATGRGALQNNTTGSNNTANGLNALFSNTTGTGNTVIGVNAGSALTTGNDNTIIGRIAGTAGLANTVIIGAGTVERMRIDSAGNVGIGTSSPIGKLTVRRDGGSAVTLQSAQAGIGELNRIDFQNISSTGTDGNATARITAFTQGNTAAGGISFSTSPSSNAPAERARIDASGKLLVGTSSTIGPGSLAPLQVSGSGTHILDLRRQGSTGNIVVFRQEDNATGSISVTATTTSYNTSSDYRLKEEVQPMVGASDRVLSLKPCNFAWKADGSRVDGFIAHEAQAVVPEAVTGDKDGEEMQVIDHSKLVPLLTAALQDALKRIEALEAQLT